MRLCYGMDHKAAYSRNRGMPQLAVVPLGSTTAFLKDRTKSVGIGYAGLARFGVLSRYSKKRAFCFQENCIIIAVSR